MATTPTLPTTPEPTSAAAGPARSPAPAPRPLGVLRDAPTPKTVLAVASLGVFVAFVDATIVNIAFPNIAASFGDASIATLSWVLNAYNIVFAAFLVAAGRIADLIGRRRVFLIGLVVFTAASLLCAVASSAGLLIAFRVVQAIGAALLVPSSLGLVLEAFPADRKAHAVALLSAVAAVAAGIGPSLGGLLVSASDWRLVFLVNVPFGVAAYVLSRKHLVESRSPGRRRVPDLLGSLVFALAVSALVLAIVKGQDWGWTSATTLGTAALAVALTGFVAWRCSWHRAPIVDLGLLRIRTFSAANAMSVVAAAGFFGYTLSNVLFLTSVWGYSVLEAGLAITPGPFVAAAVAGPTSRIAEKHGHRGVLVAGGLIWGAAVLWLVERVGTTPDFVSEWLPATILLGIGAGMTLPNLSGAAVASAPGDNFATATGLNSVARQVGAAMGVAIVVAIIGTPSPQEAPAAFDEAWLFAAGCLAAAGLGCLLVGRLDPSAAAQAPSLTRAARMVLAAEEPAVAADAAVVETPVRVQPVEETAPARPESVAEFLDQVPLLRDLPAAVREGLAAHARAVSLPAGTWLFRAGEPGDTMYVVRAGRLEVVIESDDGEDVRVLGRGAAVGELSLLTERPRSASVRAARDTDLIAIGHEDFQRLLDEGSDLALALTRSMAEQLRESRPSAPDVRPLPSTIALVPLDRDVPIRAIAEGLARALQRHGKVALLVADAIERPESALAPAAAYGPVLDRAESASDRVLLVAGDSAADPWTRFCLQQADRVLAVTSGNPASGNVGELPELAGCDLVGYGVRPGRQRLAAWAAALDPIESHTIAGGAGEQGDLDRIARRLSGRSLGIVLSGGGARAFSHIGVLEELTAAGVCIDRVAGVSMGAFVGGMFAAGMTPEEIDAHCYREWVRRRPLADYTFPRHAFIRGDRVRGMLGRVFGETAVEELPLGFLAGCADLRSGELVTLRHGPMWEAVGFSICMPVIAPPQIRGRQILVDGSLVDNLPMAAAAFLNEGPLIAVDIKATFDGGDGPKRPASADRPQSTDRPARVPSLAETLARVLLLGSANTSVSARRHGDVIIKPRNEGVGLLEFHQLDAAVESGRAAARAILEDPPAALGI